MPSTASGRQAHEAPDESRRRGCGQLPLLPGFREMAMRRMSAGQAQADRRPGGAAAGGPAFADRGGSAHGNLAIRGGAAGNGSGRRAGVHPGALRGRDRLPDHLAASGPKIHTEPTGGERPCTCGWAAIPARGAEAAGQAGRAWAAGRTWLARRAWLAGSSRPVSCAALPASLPAGPAAQPAAAARAHLGRFR